MRNSCAVCTQSRQRAQRTRSHLHGVLQATSLERYYWGASDKEFLHAPSTATLLPHITTHLLYNASRLEHGRHETEVRAEIHLRCKGHSPTEAETTPRGVPPGHP